MASSNVGHDSVGAPGDSMRGVTGRESVYNFDTGDLKTNDSRFALPVDSENKAKSFKPWSFAAPHMRSFHMSWMSFFVAFCSAFAVPPLMPIIRDNLNMQKLDVGNSGIAAITGAVASRLLIGPVCDLVGPRYGAAFLLMGLVPCICSMVLVHNVATIITVRFLIGFGLATFVTCQYWMSSMFNSKIVGLANGVAAGWGNLGGGFIQLLMPGIYALIRDSFNSPHFTAWRIAFFVPAFAHLIMGLVVLIFGQDCPDGQYLALRKTGERKADKLSSLITNAVTNYRAWIFALTYGYCFGVELTADNILANYFYDRFDLDVFKAGTIASCFGLMNIFSRPLGGILSDVAARRFGMRGRLFLCWSFQTIGGLLCILLGRIASLDSAIVVMVFFSFFVEASCGTTFGIVPFISRRSLGIVSAMAGAGGNLGSIVTQASFFTKDYFPTQDGLSYMGILIVVCTLPMLFVYFPQWGGILFPASKAAHATEENYYASEYTEAERAAGMHEKSMKFAENARSERGGRAGDIEGVELEKKAGNV